MTDKYRYLVLGTGVGAAVAHLLSQMTDTAYVTVTDETFARARQVTEKVRNLTKGLVIPRQFNADMSVYQTSQFFQEFDGIISALPSSLNTHLAEAAIFAGVPFCDLGGVQDVTEQILKLENRFRTPIVTGVGLMPGDGMMLGMDLVEMFDHCESVRVLVGGLPQKPQPPAWHQSMFNLTGLKHICYDKPLILHKGELVYVEPFSDYTRLLVSELKEYYLHGEIEIFNTAGADLAARTFQKLGVKYFKEMTARCPGFVDFVKPIPEEDFENRVAPVICFPVNEERPDLVWMRVDATGNKDGCCVAKSYLMLDTYNAKTGMTAMGRTTGYSAAIVAHMMVQNKTKLGTNTSEECMDSAQLDEFVGELQKYLPLKFQESSD